jgi:hypothetical protein
MIGSSFGHLPARMLIEQDCLWGLNFYYYAKLGRFGGPPYHEIERNLTDADLARLRGAKVMIVEENESFVARSAYLDVLLNVLNGR